MTRWLLKNPHTLPMRIAFNPEDGSVTARFPALAVSARIKHADIWKARDLAVLACAKAMVDRLEETVKEGEHVAFSTDECRSA